MGTWIDLQDEDALAHVNDAGAAEKPEPAEPQETADVEAADAETAPPPEAEAAGDAGPARADDGPVLTGPLELKSDRRPAAARVMGAGRLRLLSLYYLATPAFLLGDLGLGLNLRIAFLDPYPALKFLYYGGCFGVGVLSLRRGGMFMAAASLIETSLNITLLILSVAIPVLQIPMIVMSGGVPGNPFDPGFFAGFAVSGSFFLVAFHNNPIVRRSPRLDDHPLFRSRLF